MSGKQQIEKNRQAVVPNYKKEINLPTVNLWEGWIFYQGVIYDPAGNRYTKSDIELSWQACMIVNGHMGVGQQITILKDELQRKIRMQQLPTICFVWEDQDGVIEQTFNLTEK